MDKIIVCDNDIYRTHNEAVGIYDRLASSPSVFTDAELRQLMDMGNGRVLKGRNAKIPPMAYLEYERRHSPTEAK